MDIKQLNDKNKQYKEISLENQQNNQETEESDAPITILSKLKKRPNNESSLTIIQKFLRGYKAYKIVSEQKSRAIVVKSQNSKDSLSSNTLERATNQNDLLHLMCINKEENKEDLIKNYNIEHPTNEKDTIELIKIPKSKNQIHSKSNNRNKEGLQGDHISKSFSKIEPDLDNDNSKLKQNEMICKSLRLLKKKRPNSAKTNNEGETKEGEKINHVEEIKEIMSKLRLLK